MRLNMLLHGRRGMNLQRVADSVTRSRRRSRVDNPTWLTAMVRWSIQGCGPGEEGHGRGRSCWRGRRYYRWGRDGRDGDDWREWGEGKESYEAWRLVDFAWMDLLLHQALHPCDGILPKAKAEMDLVVPELEQCEAADEQLQVIMAETGMGFAYWHLLILVMVVSFVGYYVGLQIGQRRRQALLQEVLEHNGTLMDRVVNLDAQLERNQEERDYVRRQVEILEGTVDRGTHLRHLSRMVADRALREVTSHHSTRRRGAAWFGIDFVSAITWGRLLTNTWGSGGPVPTALVEFYHLLSVLVEKRCMSSLQNYLLLLATLTIRLGDRSLHLNLMWLEGMEVI